MPKALREPQNGLAPSPRMYPKTTDRKAKFHTSSVDLASHNLLSLQDLVLYSALYGALTQLYAGTSPEGKDFNGKVQFFLLTRPSVIAS